MVHHLMRRPMNTRKIYPISEVGSHPRVPTSRPRFPVLQILDLNQPASLETGSPEKQGPRRDLRGSRSGRLPLQSQRPPTPPRKTKGRKSMKREVGELGPIGFFGALTMLNTRQAFWPKIRHILVSAIVAQQRLEARYRTALTWTGRQTAGTPTLSGSRTLTREGDSSGTCGQVDSSLLHARHRLQRRLSLRYAPATLEQRGGDCRHGVCDTRSYVCKATRITEKTVGEQKYLLITR